MTSVLVVGAGSIGARHAGNLTQLGAEVTIMDPDRARADVAPGRAIDFDLAAAAHFPAVVLASPSIHHAEQLEKVLASAPFVLVEKPMVGQVSDLDVVAGHESRVMVGCNLRFHEPLARVRELIKAGRAGALLGGRFWFGHWLPDWRRGVDYRTTYSARADLGGGVLLDAIHELDLALWFFGEDLQVVASIVERLGPLEIDVEDTVRAMLSARGGIPVEISLDLLSRRYRRGLELVGADATVRFDWDRRQIEVDGPAGREVLPAAEPVDASYVHEMRCFLDWVAGGSPPPVDGRVGGAAVRIASEIREARWQQTR